MPSTDPILSSRRRRWALICLLSTAAPLAFAHTGQGAGPSHDALHAFIDGFTHPLTGLDHLAAMVALGVWSALTARRVALAPMAFAATLVIGALLAMGGLALPAIAPMIASSLLVLGLLVATQARMPGWAGAALAAAFALFHGAAHGQELSGDVGIAALSGMTLATALLHGAGIGVGGALKRASPWFPRIAGAGVAAFGSALLVPALLGGFA